MSTDPVVTARALSDREELNPNEACFHRLLRLMTAPERRIKLSSLSGKSDANGTTYTRLVRVLERKGWVQVEGSNVYVR